MKSFRQINPQRGMILGPLWLGVLLLSLSAILNAHFGNKPQVIEQWQGGLVTRPGTYTVTETLQTLHVWFEDDHIVHYQLKDSAGRNLFINKTQASAYQRWTIFFDKSNGWIWFSSSDIGSFVAIKTPSGTYNEIGVVSDRDLIRKMPQEIFIRLPTTLQDTWKKYR